MSLVSALYSNRIEKQDENNRSFRWSELGKYDSYYRAINEGVRKSLGGLHSAKIAMYSVDFDPIEKLQHKGDWETTAKVLSKAAQNIQLAGADFLLICTNTMHKVAPQIKAAIDIPLLHIADATAEVLIENRIKKVGLLGTAFTMEQNSTKVG